MSENNSFPDRIKAVTRFEGDDGEADADVVISITQFLGIGSHYHIDAHQGISKVRGDERGWYEMAKTGDPKRIKDLIMGIIKKRHPRKKTVTIFFRQSSAQKWFYKDGD
jgi:hypothetical protein